ncbi:hypothetical protein HOLleu_37578 [Holothuria leucospilota]|uniref:Uncharacterized protein n=1 Tax=Holothuria leucospilota TaxID=206669 RepID=A0A9Q1BEV2_HOLLE|nr:hypothetical protein HOLleu_37578 [Holothuria leucospilota]
MDLIPKGLKLKNPLSSTLLERDIAENICRRASEKLRNLALKCAYNRQHLLNNQLNVIRPQLLGGISNESAQEDMKLFISSCYKRSLSKGFERKHKKLVKLSRDHDLPAHIHIPRRRPVRHKDLRTPQSEAVSTVFNLSSKPLSITQSNLLEQGLSFCPSNEVDRVQPCSDFEQFVRKTRIKEFFREQSNEPWTKPINYKPSPWTPPSGRNSYIDAFVDAARKHLDSFLLNKDNITPAHNITKTQKKAISDLRKETSIVLKPADKGGSIVILDKED